MRAHYYLLFCQCLFSLPINPQVQIGEVSFRSELGKLEVQTGAFADLSWDDFSIESNESVQFFQKDSSSVVVNRVITETPSRILGNVYANGHVVLLNPNGVLVGKSAMISTNALTASTLDLIGDVRNGEIQFGGNSNASITHDGMVLAEDEIRLVSGGGKTIISGVLQAKKRVHAFGRTVALIDEGLIDVSGKEKGGEVLFGGDYQGASGFYTNAHDAFVGDKARILANAHEQGNGGKVVVWADHGTVFHGSIEARGGSLGGNGGLIEVSGKEHLEVRGHVNTESPFGLNGTVLFDPCSVTINGADSGFTTSTSMGVTTFDFDSNPTSTISAATLIGLLGANDVVINATDTGSAGAGSITLADGSGPIMWAAATSLTLIADDFIQINDEITPQSLAFSPFTNVVSLNAPRVQLGPSTARPAVETLSGQIYVNAPTSFTLLSSTVPASSRGGLQAGTINAGGIEIHTGDLLANATTRGILIQASQRITISATGDIELNGGSATSPNTAEALIVSQSDAVTITCGGNCSLISGSGAAVVNAAILASNATNTGVRIQVAGDLLIQGGGATAGGNGTTGIALQAGVADYFDVSAASITLNSGTGTASNITLIANVGGAVAPMTITSLGPINLNANDNHLAYIGTAASLGGSGSVTINAGSLNLIASATPGSADPLGIGARIHANGGDLVVNVAGDIFAQGGGGASSNPAGIIVESMGNSSAITAQNVTLIGGTSDDSFCTIQNNYSSTTISISGDYFIQSGSGMNAGAGIPTAFLPGGVGDLVISGRNYTLIGGSGPDSPAAIVTGSTSGFSGGDGSLFLTATGDISLTGGDLDPTGLAAIATNGTLTTNALSIQCMGNVNLTGGSASEAAIYTLGGALSMMVGSDINMTSGAFDAHVYIGGGSSTLQMEAGGSLSVNSSIENLGSGDLILVVDGNYPQPFVGPGSFTLGPSASLISGGALRIFTSQQQLNTILGTVNGLSFAPGTLFQDSATEIWCTYFPSLAGGFPYTIFYKECEQILASQSQIVSSESLSNFNAFNEFPGWWAKFTISSVIPQWEFSSPYFITRRHSPNFWHPKSYTVFLHDLMEYEQ